LINRQTSRLDGFGSPVLVGRDLGSSFPPEVADEILSHIGTTETVHLRQCDLGRTRIDLHLSPLSGRFRGQGLVITMHPNPQPTE
jgi:hypothetical protein